MQMTPEMCYNSFRSAGSRRSRTRCCEIFSTLISTRRARNSTGKYERWIKSSRKCSDNCHHTPLRYTMENEIALAVAIGDRIAERIESRFTVMPTLTLDQAAETLGVSNEKMRQLCNDGKIPFIRVDKFYRIKPGDINRYLEQNYHKQGARK